MTKTIFHLLIASISFVCTAQQPPDSLRFSGTFIPKDKSAAYVAVYGNEGQDGIIAQAKVTNGKFSMSLPNNLPFGVYMLGFGMQDKVYFYLVHQPKVNAYTVTIENRNNQWTFNSTTGSEHAYLTAYWQQEQALLKPLSILYYFLENYPLRQEAIYENNSNVLKQKIKAFHEFRDAAIAKAPPYSKELLEQNKIILHNPQWTPKERETHFYNTLWERIPANDSNYYKKPYFGDKLEQVFGSILENKQSTEKDKLADITTNLNTLITHLKEDRYNTKYYNLMLRYFMNKQYPYVLSRIDPYINPSELLTPQDSLSYVYRQAQHSLIGQKAKTVLDTKGEEVLKNTAEADRTVLVFVGGNTPLSLEVLQQLDKEINTLQNTKVIAVLLGSTHESLQNFKSLFPNWSHFRIENAEQIQKTVEAYKLVFAPTIFVLDANQTIKKQLGVFETILENH